MARLFFALWPDRKSAEALACLGEAIAKGAGGRAVPAARLHLTLVFLGEVEPSRIAGLHRAAGRVEGRPFRLVLDEAGCFMRAGVAWAGFRQPARELIELQSSLQRELEAEGFPPEPRRFSPHLTLARRISAPVATEPVTPVSWHATAFALVESGREGGYATLAQWPLAGQGKQTQPASR